MIGKFKTDVALLGRARIAMPNRGRSPTALLILLREERTRARTARLGAEHIQRFPCCIHLGRVSHEHLRERPQHTTTKNPHAFVHRFVAACLVENQPPESKRAFECDGRSVRRIDRVSTLVYLESNPYSSKHSYKRHIKKRQKSGKKENYTIARAYARAVGKVFTGRKHKRSSRPSGPKRF